MSAETYLGRVGEMMTRVREEQLSALQEAGKMVADVVETDGLVHVFGTGHSHMLVEESLYRAGGLAAVNGILDTGLMLHEGATASTRLERLSGYSGIVAGKHKLESRDLLIVISNSGVNAVPVEMAVLARESGLKVIAICSMVYSRATDPKPGVGRRLFEVADLTLDNLGDAGDAAVELDGHGFKVGPTSTVIGAALLNAIFVEASALLADKGVDPPIYISSNMPGATEHNKELVDRFRGRVRNL